MQAFDLRMVAAIRAFLANGGLPIRRRNVAVAAFVIYHSVRATMLARLLEAPAGVGDAALVDELTDLVVSYLIGTPGEPAPSRAGLSRAGPSGRRSAPSFRAPPPPRAWCGRARPSSSRPR